MHTILLEMDPLSFHRMMGPIGMQSYHQCNSASVWMRKGVTMIVVAVPVDDQNRGMVLLSLSPVVER